MKNNTGSSDQGDNPSQPSQRRGTLDHIRIDTVSSYENVNSLRTFEEKPSTGSSIKSEGEIEKPPKLVEELTAICEEYKTSLTEVLNKKYWHKDLTIISRKIELVDNLIESLRKDFPVKEFKKIYERQDSQALLMKDRDTATVRFLKLVAQCLIVGIFFFPFWKTRPDLQIYNDITECFKKDYERSKKVLQPEVITPDSPPVII